MNAITPPKLMPPFQSTAARGIFLTEHTKEMTATSGPTIGPQQLGNKRVVDKEERLPELGRHPGGERTGNEQAAGNIEPDRSPVHHEIVADCGEALL
jgi:hypothetical protein